MSVVLPLSSAAIESVPPPREYEAVYKVLRKDKRLANVTVRLSRQGDTWTLHGFTHDMRGLADVLNVKGSQKVTGKWRDGRFFPETFDFSFSLIGYKTTWDARFDWQSGIVTTHTKSGKTELPLTSGAVDPFSLFLNVRSYLSLEESPMAVDIVDEDEIENHLYEADLEESLETALGCLESTRVKRIRKNSKRTSLVWYANDYDHVPLQMQHFKKKGKGMKLQIISLNIGGQEVHPLGPCASDKLAINQAGAN